jgi:hypothetical protein
LDERFALLASTEDRAWTGRRTLADFSVPIAVNKRPGDNAFTDFGPPLEFAIST